MKSVLFTLILMSFGLFAAPVKHIPVPDCFPCNDEPAQVTVSVAHIPVPDCFPCNDEPAKSTLAVAHIPVPDCFPCNDQPLQLTDASDSRFFLRRSQL